MLEFVKLKGLIYNNELMGVRVYTSSLVIDLSKSFLSRFGFTDFNTKQSVELIPFDANNSLVTQEELDGLEVFNIDTNKKLYVFVTKDLFNNDKFIQELEGYQLPFTISVGEFISNSTWRFVIGRNDKNFEGYLYDIVTPDGRVWQKAFFSLHNDTKLIKAEFHKKVVISALQQGFMVSESALVSYPMLQQVEKNITDAENMFVLNYNEDEPLLSSTIELKQDQVYPGAIGGFNVLVSYIEAVKDASATFYLYEPIKQFGLIDYKPLVLLSQYADQQLDQWFSVSRLVAIVLLRLYHKVATPRLTLDNWGVQLGILPREL